MLFVSTPLTNTLTVLFVIMSRKLSKQGIPSEVSQTPPNWLSASGFSAKYFLKPSNEVKLNAPSIISNEPLGLEALAASYEARSFSAKQAALTLSAILVSVRVLEKPKAVNGDTTYSPFTFAESSNFIALLPFVATAP